MGISRNKKFDLLDPLCLGQGSCCEGYPIGPYIYYPDTMYVLILVLLINKLSTYTDGTHLFYHLKIV